MAAKWHREKMAAARGGAGEWHRETTHGHGTPSCGAFRRGPAGYTPAVRTGNRVQIRPLGGAAGCLAMVLVSVVLSVLLTVVLNLLIR